MIGIVFSKNYTTDQKRMIEGAKKKAKREVLTGLNGDKLQIAAGTGLVVIVVREEVGVVLIVGVVNEAINHFSIVTTGNSFNIVGNLTKEL
ncbi:hypothetical protein [Clostridium felsineum]|uniref:hypothetical protein n=1 Tax=Clostridium felsineum TaxID=36839 RepID=UPI00098C62C0|nr:hypothetical protein [Clostridium felsineum]URZ15093.1 hypothetical protein CLFE_011100 [Clostridium felsineum DSM 794]